MFQVIGVKRILMLIILIAANAALAAVTYLYVMPEKQGVEQQLNMTRAQISQKRGESERLRTEFQQIQEQKANFENMRAAGIISNQNRLAARRRIMDIQEYSRVLKASYDIGSAEVEQTKAATDIRHVILNSPVGVDIEAIDDRDIFSFIYWMENAFPGHVAVTSLKIERVLDVNDATLRAIGSGTPVVLVRGAIDFVWRTMAPEEEVRAAQEFGSEGF